MAGFDPVVIMIVVLAAAIIVLLIRTLSQSGAQPTGAALRNTTTANSPPFTGQSLSDISGKPVGQRISTPRLEQPPLPTPAIPLANERKSAPPEPPLSFETTKREVVSEPPFTPESHLPAIDNGVKEKETEQTFVSASNDWTAQA